GLSSQNLKARELQLPTGTPTAELTTQNTHPLTLHFEHGMPKSFNITTTYGLPDALKREVASWHEAMMNIMSNLPLPERWVTSIERYLSPIVEAGAPSGIRLQVDSNTISGSLSSAGDTTRLQFRFDDTSAQKDEYFNFTLVDEANPHLDIQVNATLEFTVDCTNFYDAVLGEWSVTLTGNYGNPPATYQLQIYEGGYGEYVTGGDVGNEIRYRVTWGIYSGSGLNGYGCLFSESGFWHFAFDSNPSTILNDPLTGFYTEEWFNFDDGRGDI